MMSYEMFREVVSEKFIHYLPARYQNGVLDVHSVRKVNRVLDGITVHMDGENVAPTAYIDDMYEKYKWSGNLEAVLSRTAEEYVKADEDFRRNKPEMDPADLKDNVVMSLINTEQNKELLEEIPHREFQDLSVIYQWIVSQDAIGLATTMVTNDIMQEAEMTEEELFRYASENTRRINPVKITSLQEVLLELTSIEAIPPEVKAELTSTVPPDQTYWVITNETGVKGAVSMLYENELHKLAEKIGSDLYILPSSIHEVMAVPVNMGTAEYLSEMVQDVNDVAVELDSWLSDNVYHYDKDLRKLTMVTDVPNKRLEGDVSKNLMGYEPERKR